jgi:hypothetical protein
MQTAFITSGKLDKVTTQPQSTAKSGLDKHTPAQ